MNIFYKFLIISLLLGFCTGEAISSDSWDGSIDESWYNTSETSFTLTTAAQFAGIASLVNSGTEDFDGKTISLGAAIDLASIKWTPIGTFEHPFAGTLDFNNYELANLLIADTTDADGAYGLIGYGSDALVKNANLAVGCKIFVSDIMSSESLHQKYVGGLIGYNKFSKATSLNFESCNTYCEINAGSSFIGYFGGLIGYSEIPLTTFIHCNNFGNISCNKEASTCYECYVGGLVGASKRSNFSFCKNQGDIYTYGMYYAYGAGMIAKRLNIEYDTTMIHDCHNSGNIEAHSAKNESVTAGIIASFYPTTSHLIISNCENFGSMSSYAKNSPAYAAGIIGVGYSIDMTRCFNQGDLISRSDPKIDDHIFLTSAYAGGLVAYSGYSQVLISNCYNTGNILTKAPSHKTFLGGIIGVVSDFADDPLELSSCYNIGQLFCDSLNLISNTIGHFPYSEPIFTRCYAAKNLITVDSALTWLDENATGLVTYEPDYMKTDEFLALLNGDQNPQPWTFKTDNNNGFPILEFAHYLTANEEIITNDNVLCIYPNPIGESLHFEFSAQSPYEACEVNIIDISGNLIYSSIFTSNDINLSNLAKGKYFLFVRTAKETFSKEFIKI